jgi:hypothetical protein
VGVTNLFDGTFDGTFSDMTNKKEALSLGKAFSTWFLLEESNEQKRGAN